MYKISTQINLNNYVQYILFSQKKSLKFFKIFGSLLLVFAGFSFVMSIVEFDTFDNFIFDIIITALIIFFGLLLIFLKSFVIKSTSKQFNSNKFLSSQPVMTFQFNENNYKVLTTSSLGIEDCTYSYEMINGIVETKNYLFICIANNTAYIINKQQDDMQNVENIINFLKQKFDKRYVIEQ